MIARRGSGAAALGALALVLVLSACASDGGPESTGGGVQAADTPADCPDAAPVALVPEVVRELPHDPEAYTQGLVVHEGRLFESTGRYGASSVRELDPDTGEVLERVELDDEVFGEGLAVGEGGRLVQLTWREGVAFVRDPDDLREVERFSYDGEGWGLTTLDDGTLVMSDGSDALTRRDPGTFDVVDEREVTRSGGDADLLNELEWDGEHLWANRYQTDEVLRIDVDCDVVTGVLDVSELTDAARRAQRPGQSELGVSNGVAHLPGTDRYLLTGKDWPLMFEVTIARG